MEITIEYNSCWRNSFLDKTNNEKMDKDNKRTYIASCQGLVKPENFIKREVTIDTVMGVLNRLIGDQRKLWQAREDDDYYFKDIEPLISFDDNITCLSQEIVVLKNQSGHSNPAGLSGCYNTNSPIFTSDFSAEMWGIFAMDFEEVLDYIVTGKDPLKTQNLKPQILIEDIESLKKIKASEYDCQAAFDIITAKYAAEFKNEVIEKASAVGYYFSAFYLKIEELSNRGFNVASILSKKGCLKGFSKRTFTKSDFNSIISTGGRLRIMGNPYFVKGRVNELNKMLTKADGTVTITLNIDKDKSLELKNMIDDAGVSSFILGKKGLAYVSNMRI